MYFASECKRMQASLQNIRMIVCQLDVRRKSNNFQYFEIRACRKMIASFKERGGEQENATLSKLRVAN